MTIISSETPLLLPRRRMLQGVAAFSAARVLTAPAFAQLQGGTPSSSPPIAPLQAAAVGYHNLTFLEDFDSLQGVDVNNTRARGYNWYVNNGWPNGSSNISKFLPTPASCFSQSGSILTCGPTVPDSTSRGGAEGNSGLLLSTACADPLDPTKYIGQTFTNGYYAECSLAMKFNSGFAPPCPAFWGLPVEMSVQPSYFPYVELDYMEHTSGRNDMNFNVYEWTTGINVRGINDVRTLDGTLTNQNIYGCLNVPMSQNGGAGYLKYYFNNRLFTTIYYSAPALPSPTFANAAAGSLSEIDAGHYYLILGWQNVGTIAVDWVKVWQL